MEMNNNLPGYTPAAYNACALYTFAPNASNRGVGVTGSKHDLQRSQFHFEVSGLDDIMLG